MNLKSTVKYTLLLVAALVVGLVMGFGSTSDGLKNFKGKKALKKA